MKYCHRAIGLVFRIVLSFINDSKAFVVLILFPIFFSFLSPAIAESYSSENKSRPKIALVFEGGGAKGFAHVGVLKILESERVPIDFIVGTSMGSIVAAAYASGRTVREMEHVLSTTNWDELFNETPPRQSVNFREKVGRGREIFGDTKIGIKDGGLVTSLAFIEGQHVVPLLQTLFGKAASSISFDDLPIPYRAVAADITTGEAVVLDRGDLALAARASMSVPGFFAPVEIDGRLLVDGGISNNLPVDVALNMGAEVIIAVECKDTLRPREKLAGPLAISGQILDLLLERTTQSQLKLLRPQDIHVVVNPGEYGSTDFARAKEIMLLGENAATQLRSEFKKLAVSEHEYENFQTLRTKGSEFAPVIEYIEVRGVPLNQRKAIAKVFDSALGKTLDRMEMERELRELHDAEGYKVIAYDIEQRDAKYGLIITAQEKDWLKNYLRLGFSLEDDFEGGSNYSVALAARTTQLNEFGAYAESQLEIGRSPRLFVEFYQPLAQASSFFIAPEFTLSRQNLNLSQDGELLAEYRRDMLLFGLKGGASLGRYGELSTGRRRGPAELDRRIGDPSLPELSYDIGEVFSQFELDQYDNPDFPRKGYRIIVTGTASREGLGSNADFEQARAIGGIPFTFGQNTLLLNAEVGRSSENLPAERGSSFGGFFDISGFTQSSLLASDYHIGRAVIYRRISETSGMPLFQFGGFAGLSFEFAALRSDIEAIKDEPNIVAGSAFLGFDTPLLPAYLAFGTSDASEHSFYFNLGRLAGRRR